MPANKPKGRGNKFSLPQPVSTKSQLVTPMHLDRLCCRSTPLAGAQQQDRSEHACQQQHVTARRWLSAIGTHSSYNSTHNELLLSTDGGSGCMRQQEARQQYGTRHRASHACRTGQTQYTQARTWVSAEAPHEVKHAKRSQVHNSTDTLFQRCALPQDTKHPTRLHMPSHILELPCPHILHRPIALPLPIPSRLLCFPSSPSTPDRTLSHVET